jgi:virulence-associated protein VagC
VAPLMNERALDMPSARSMKKRQARAMAQATRELFPMAVAFNAHQVTIYVEGRPGLTVPWKHVPLLKHVVADLHRPSTSPAPQSPDLSGAGDVC